MADSSPPIAAIDIGSNSIQLTLARVKGPRILVIDRLKDAARLSNALGPDRTFSDETIDRTIATLRRFRAMADRHDAVVRATATAALRAAKNGEVVIERAAREAGIRIEQISGADEGRLVLTGVLHGLPGLRRAAPLCVDVGGGSTEMIFGRDGRAAVVASVPLGSLVVSRRWLGPDPVKRHKGRRALSRVMARLSDRANDARRIGFTHAVGTGGSIQRIARIALAMQGRHRGPVHGVRIPREALGAVVARLMRAETVQQRRAIPGMDPERADTLLGGALVFEALSRMLDIKAWVVSMDALRAGLIIDTNRQVLADLVAAEAPPTDPPTQ